MKRSSCASHWGKLNASRLSPTSQVEDLSRQPYLTSTPLEGDQKTATVRLQRVVRPIGEHYGRNECVALHFLSKSPNAMRKKILHASIAAHHS